MGGFEPQESYETVRVLRDDAAVIVEMHRPEVLNAWNQQLGADMLAALRRCADPDVRAVMVTGAGRGFCSGADVSAFAAAGGAGPPDLERELLLGQAQKAATAAKTTAEVKIDIGGHDPVSP